MPEIIFRAVMIIILVSLPIFLGIKDLTSPFGFDSRVLVVAGVCLSFILLLGPLWPNERKIKRINNFFDRYPRSSSIAGYLILSASGFFLAWVSATNSAQYSSGSLRAVYKTLGPAGVTSIWVVFGFIGLAGFLNAIKNKS